MAYLILDSQTIYNNTVTLRNGQKAKTTPKSVNGRWYYECTHISGDNYHLCGFSINSNYGGIYAYPQGCTTCIKLHFNTLTVYENIKVDTNVGFTGVIKEHTIGLGFHTYTRTFTIIYDNQTAKFTIRNEIKETSVSPMIFEATPFEDTISANFGENDFKYQVPYGFLPWNCQNREHSCLCRCMKINMIHTALFIAVTLTS